MVDVLTDMVLASEVVGLVVAVVGDAWWVGIGKGEKGEWLARARCGV